VDLLRGPASSAHLSYFSCFSPQTKASTSMASEDEEAVCYLCLDGGLDEAGQTLRRDCACRGTDAGFVHLSCLTGYAESKSKQARDEI
jgi:hypothetical protein